MHPKTNAVTHIQLCFLGNGVSKNQNINLFTAFKQPTLYLLYTDLSSAQVYVKTNVVTHLQNCLLGRIAIDSQRCNLFTALFLRQLKNQRRFFIHIIVGKAELQSKANAKNKLQRCFLSNAVIHLQREHLQPYLITAASYEEVHLRTSVVTPLQCVS